MKKRLLAMLLTFAMLLTLLPMAALADETEELLTVTPAEGTELSGTVEFTVAAAAEIDGAAVSHIHMQYTYQPMTATGKACTVSTWLADEDGQSCTVTLDTTALADGSIQDVGCGSLRVLVELQTADGITVYSVNYDYMVNNLAAIAWGSFGENLQWVLDQNGVLNIRGTGAMASCETEYAPWYAHFKHIKTVILAEGITSIGDDAFSGCSELTSITIPESVETIGAWAFYNCSALQSVTIPEGVTTIGENAFCNSGLTGVTIPKSVQQIGSRAFQGCTNLETAEILNDSTVIGEDAFSGCKKLADENGFLIVRDVLYAYTGTAETVVIPEGITRISSGTFQSCTDLRHVTIPESVRSLGNSVFAFCSNLEEVDIPAGVTLIDGYTFYNCTSLSRVTIPDSVVQIEQWAFGNCTSLKTITLPEQLETLGWFAFGNSGITEITIPDNVTSLDGGNNFTYCSALSSVTIGTGAEKISCGEFGSCTSLASITIPEGVTLLDMGAFSECTALQTVYLPASVTAIGIDAFRSCTSLTDVWFAGTRQQWNELTIVNTDGGNDPLLQATIHCQDSTICDITPTEEGSETPAAVPEAQQANIFTEIQDTEKTAEFTAEDTEGALNYSWTFAGSEITDPTVSVTSFAVQVISEPDAVTEAAENQAVNAGITVQFTHEGALPGPAEIQLNVGTDYADGTYNLYYYNPDTKALERCETPAVVKDGIATFRITHCSVYVLGSEQKRTCTRHYWSVGQVTTAPTCTEAGVKTYTCMLCGEKDTVAIPALGHCWDDGRVKTEPTETEKGMMLYACTRCGKIRQEPIPALGDTAANPFADVQDYTQYYYRPVLWAAATGVTAGVTATTFAPDAVCTRGEVVTFLWRMAGARKVKSENPFTDVSEADWYYDAVLWGYRTGVVKGVTATTFEPDATVTRAQFVTFLYRYAGEPDLSDLNAVNPFTDVAADAYYVDAVRWGYLHGIVRGTDATTFEPAATCTRGQVVTFLYRYAT